MVSDCPLNQPMERPVSSDVTAPPPVRAAKAKRSLRTKRGAAQCQPHQASTRVSREFRIISFPEMARKSSGIHPILTCLKLC